MVQLVRLSLAVLSVLLSSAAAAGAVSRRVSSSTLRALEDNGYQYMEDLTSYEMAFGKCVRVKVPDDGDDEGNSYFYNGHYYALSQQFASVYLCESSYGGGDNEKEEGEDGYQCGGTCDTSKEYVTDLATYLQYTLEYANTMCQSCNAICGNGRRHLEEEEGEGGDVAYMNVNCNTCVNTCSRMNFNNYNAEGDDNNNGGGGYDETSYLECQEAFQDENGIQIYAGPQCDGDGDIIIGFYYDEDCTVKSSSATHADFGFEYGTFKGLQSMCLNCNPYQNGEDDVCQDLYGGAAAHCASGKDLSGAEDDMPICKSYQKAHREHIYGHRRRNMRYVEMIIAVVLVGGLLWGFFTLSWTYYLRHRSGQASAKVPLTAEENVSEPEVMITNKEVS